MQIAVTGATGFLGRYVVQRLISGGHDVRCWRRASSDVRGLPESVEWIEGVLGDPASCASLVTGCDAVVHSALSRSGTGFMGAEGSVVDFVQTNVVGTLQLIEAARTAGVSRFVFVATCAVHDVILEDRPLDEAHPLWPKSHYGAHKAALEKFVHSYGLGDGYPVCSLRPTGIYGLAHPPDRSKWFDLVRHVSRGDSVECVRGGKEVHVADVAKAIEILLHADSDAITGQAFSCYDRYVSQWDVAHLAKEISGSDAEIIGGQTRPKNQIETGKLRGLGMVFGGDELLRDTIVQIVDATRTLN